MSITALDATDGTAAAALLQQTAAAVSTDDDAESSFDALLSSELSDGEADTTSDLSGLCQTKQLSNEEEQRLQWLQDQLADALAALGEPTDEEEAGDRRRRIRELQQEIEDLTGVKMPVNLAAASKKMPTFGKDDKDDDEDDSKQDDPLLQHVLGADRLTDCLGTSTTGNTQSGAGVMSWWQQNLAAVQATVQDFVQSGTEDDASTDSGDDADALVTGLDADSDSVSGTDSETGTSSLADTRQALSGLDAKAERAATAGIAALLLGSTKLS